MRQSTHLCIARHYILHVFLPHVRALFPQFVSSTNSDNKITTKAVEMRGSIQTHARTQPQIGIPSHIARYRTGIHSHQLCGLRFITQTSQVNFELDFNGFRETLLINVTRLERFLNCPQILFHSFTKSIFFLMNEYCEIQRGKRQNCIHRLLNIDYKPLTFCCIH